MSETQNDAIEASSSATAWWLGIRPRTLSLAVVPVVVGSTLAWSHDADVHIAAFCAAVLCASLIQIGTNLLNDAGDAERGADGPDRVGPLRITASGLASATDVKRAAAASFVAALLTGAYLVYVGGPIILGIGLVSIAAGYAYSSGPRPLSYSASGEVFVLTFFGVIAVAGSYYLQSRSVQSPGLSGESIVDPLIMVGPVLATGVALGCHAAAVLLVNNIRDGIADAKAGRATLALRLGPSRSRQLYTVLMLLPYPLLAAAFGTVQLATAWLSLPLCLWLAWRFKNMPTGAAMNGQLAFTALAQMLLGALLGVSFVL